MYTNFHLETSMDQGGWAPLVNAKKQQMPFCYCLLKQLTQKHRLLFDRTTSLETSV